jgi:mRNA interferase MazF
VSATATNGLSKDSGADSFQVKSVAADRFVSKLGILSEDEIERVVAGIKLCIGAN